ncbi:MAG: TerB family tellurite resistance protein [Pseudomonadota bacterium]
MHLLGGLLVLIGAVAVWYWRVRMARDAAGDAIEAGNDIRLSARRLMYKRKHDVHPADCVDDPRLAAAGIAVAVATMDHPISQAEIAALTDSARQTFDVTEREALDIVSFGRWVADQCNTQEEAVRRLSKVVASLAGPNAADDLVAMIQAVSTAGGAELGEDELAAIETVRRVLASA